MESRFARNTSNRFAALAIIVSIVTAGIAIRANQLADKAINHSDKQHHKSQQLTRRIVELERESARPTLTAIRSRSLDESTFVVTIQNNGQRHVAIMSVEFMPSSIQNSASAGVPNMRAPISNIAPTLAIDLSNMETDASPWDLTPPLIIEPGAIVNVKLTKPKAIVSGMLQFRSSEGNTTDVGYLDGRSATTLEDDSQHDELDDLFDDSETVPPLGDRLQR